MKFFPLQRIINLLLKFMYFKGKEKLLLEIKLLENLI